MAAGASDAQWFVSTVDSELRVADWADETSLILSQVMRRVHERFLDEAIAPHEHISAWPFASLSLVRCRTNEVEFANLGDCRILWSRAGNGVGSFGSSRVTELDEAVVNEIRRLHQIGVTDRDAVWRSIVPRIESNRKLKNVPGGYWILDVEGRGLAGLQIMREESSLFDMCVMCTDGFYRLVDPYRKYTDPSLLLDVEHKGVNALIQMIRAIEQRDRDGIEFPRIKSSDDATAISIKFRLCA